MEAATSLEKRSEKVDLVSNDIETELQLLGCTAIEDRLQDYVPETIEYLRKAGMHIWMITGNVFFVSRNFFIFYYFFHIFLNFLEFYYLLFFYFFFTI